jgi:hypothetical protein
MLAKEEQIVLPREQAVKYLQVYNADIDWNPHLNTLYSRLTKKLGEEAAKIAIRKQIACTILLPTIDSSVHTDPPENLLFWCSSYHQYDSRDWIKELFEVWKKDEKIEEIRGKCLEVGIVYPLEYNPNTRQAFNWLTDCANRSGCISDENKEHIYKKLQNLVFAYGGVVICSVFGKPEYSKKIDKIPNWRSAYFFEKLIHEVYKSDEILKIKQHEINKIKSVNSRLVKKIKG